MREIEELVHNYLCGNLSEKENQRFEKRLEEDPEILYEYKFQKDMKDAIHEEDIMELRNKLENLTSTGQIYNKSSFYSRFKYIAAAAILLLVLGVGSWFFVFESRSNPSEIYTNYYSPYENIYSVRSLEIKYAEDDLVRDAFIAYENGNWEKADEYFNMLVSQKTGNMSFIFYSGIVKLERNKPKEAIPRFRSVMNSQNNLFSEQAYWYISLTYLKIGDMMEAKYYLNQIVAKEMNKKDEAREILRKL